MTSEAIYFSATTLARNIQDKTISAEELVNLHLQRIEEVNPELNAVVQLAAERAIEEAREADQALSRGETKGRLHGLPITLKDSHDTEGIISTWGTKGREKFMPDKDATTVARLRSEGAIILGKTNTPEFTMDGETDNLVYGRTNNPYDVSKSPAGSSGGAAAIIAAGGSTFDLGTDTGGSIRGPSHSCGIAGIKPTSGRVPRTGHALPSCMGASDALTQIGPMARYVEDLWLVLSIISGEDGYDPAIVPMSLGDPESVDLRGLRVAVYTDNGIQAPTSDISETVNRSAKVLEEAGAITKEAVPAPLKRVADLYDRITDSDGQAWMQRLLDRVGTKEASPVISKSMSAAKPVSSEEYTLLLEELDDYRSEMLQFIQDYDAILCPVSAFPALPHGATYQPEYKDFSHTSAYNLTGWPGAVVRAGTSSVGLPIGVQAVAHPWREDVALALVAEIETALGGYQRPNI